MSLQTLSTDGFWAAEVNFLVCRLQLFARALQSPTPAISPVYGATDIPIASQVRIGTQFKDFCSCCGPTVCEISLAEENRT